MLPPGGRARCTRIALVGIVGIGVLVVVRVCECGRRWWWWMDCRLDDDDDEIDTLLILTLYKSIVMLRFSVPTAFVQTTCKFEFMVQSS